MEENGTMNRFQTVFGVAKPVIGMVHLGALPGSPLHDVKAGIDGLVESAHSDIVGSPEGRFRRSHVRQRE